MGRVGTAGQGIRDRNDKIRTELAGYLKLPILVYSSSLKNRKREREFISHKTQI